MTFRRTVITVRYCEEEKKTCYHIESRQYDTYLYCIFSKWISNDSKPLEINNIVYANGIKQITPSIHLQTYTHTCPHTYLKHFAINNDAYRIWCKNNSETKQRQTHGHRIDYLAKPCTYKSAALSRKCPMSKLPNTEKMCRICKTITTNERERVEKH